MELFNWIPSNNMLWLTENDTGRNLETVLKETTRDNKGYT
jgi:hypothetical protein